MSSHIAKFDDLITVKDQSRPLVRSGTFVSETGSEKVKGTNKGKNQKDLTSSATTSQLTRPVSVPESASQVSSDLSKKSMTSTAHQMILPHPPGKLPKYHRSFNVTAKASRSSLASSVSTNPANEMSLPHTLGSLPKYLQKKNQLKRPQTAYAELSKSCNISSSPSQVKSEMSKYNSISALSNDDDTDSSKAIDTRQVSCCDDVTVILESPSMLQRSGTFVGEQELELSKKLKKQTKLPRKALASSTVSQLTSPQQGAVTTKSSMISLASSKAGMTLPHNLGSIPKYLRQSNVQIKTKSRPETASDERSNSCLPRSCNLSKAQSRTTLAVEVSDDDAVQLKNRIKEMSGKAIEDKNKAFALKQNNETLKKQLAEYEKKFADASSSLKEKTEKLTKAEASIARSKRDAKKGSSECEQRISDQEEKLAKLHKTHDETLKRLQEKDETCKQLEKKLDDVTTEKSSIENALKSLQLKHNQRITTLEEMVADAENQLKSCDSEIATLKHDTLNFDLSCGSDDIMSIKRQVIDLKNSLKKSQLEVQSIDTKLNDERQKNLRSENLLQLREEYIRNLQETDETLRRRLTLQAEDVEKLREKVEQEKQFKTATNEELQSLHSTLASQDLETKNLQLAIESKDRKLKKWRNKLVESGVEY